MSRSAMVRPVGTGSLWLALVEDWNRWQLAAGRPTTTRELRRVQLEALARDYSDPAAITTDDLVSWLAGHTWSVETLRSYRAALRTFWRWAAATGRLPADVAAALPSVRPASHVARPAPEIVWREAMATATPRVRLAIMLGAYAGLRRAEIAAVRREDVTADLVGSSLIVRGKGGKYRVVPLLPDLERAIRSCPPGWLFPSPSGGHLTPHHLGKLITAAMRGRATTHQLRHRFATATYAGTPDLATVQELLGHASTETTRTYVQVSRRRLAAAVAGAA